MRKIRLDWRCGHEEIYRCKGYIDFTCAGWGHGCLLWIFTVREVVKYFGDITLCLFSGSCDENDIDKLAAKLFQLFDGELAENNSWADYLVRLHGEIDEYQKAGQTVTGYAPAGSANVNFFDQDGYEWARLYCTFYIKTGKESKVTNQIFLLRKDADRHWKIYGWDLAENVDLTQEETVTEEN